jgi:hypothetical protein
MMRGEDYEELSRKTQALCIACHQLAELENKQLQAAQALTEAKDAVKNQDEKVVEIQREIATIINRSQSEAVPLARY